MAKDFDDSEGVWRTIAGRKVFIREGQSLSSAMKQSGKFKSKKQKLGNSDEDKEIKGRIEELQREIESGRNSKEKTERLKNELQQYKENYDYEKEKLTNSDVDKEIKGRIKELENEINSNRNNKERIEKLKEELQQYKDKYETNSDKNLNDLKQERDAKFREIVDANTERQNIYENATWDEAYKDMYGKEKEKNAKTELSKEDYKKFEELTNKYHEGRKQLADLDKKIDEYRKSHPEEHAKEKQERQAKREEYLKTHLSLNETLDNPKRSIEISKEAKRLGISEREAKNLMDEREYGKKDHTFKMNDEEKRKYENVGKKIDNLTKEIEEKNKTYTGYQQYLRDRYGTENEDVVSAGNKSKSKLYQEYKDETIRRVNRERMTPGVTNIETAYKRAFEKYKKEHPNTKLNFQEFKKMTEE